MEGQGRPGGDSAGLRDCRATEPAWGVGEPSGAGLGETLDASE